MQKREMQPLVVVGMGKLGGGELNFSSDVDLVLLFPEHGETDGAGAIANEEFFTRLGQSLIRLLETPTSDGFVLRYDSATSKDGLPPGEGAFLACSFWLADAYLLLGRREDAEKLFRRLIGLCNDVGLLSEEYDPRAKRQLGNFPQAFSHVAMVSCARILSDEDVLLARRV